MQYRTASPKYVILPTILENSFYVVLVAWSLGSDSAENIVINLIKQKGLIRALDFLEKKVWVKKLDFRKFRVKNE